MPKPHEDEQDFKGDVFYPSAIRWWACDCGCGLIKLLMYDSNSKLRVIYQDKPESIMVGLQFGLACVVDVLSSERKTDTSKRFH